MHNETMHNDSYALIPFIEHFLKQRLSLYIYIYIYIYQYMERRCFRKCSMKGIRA